MLVLGTLVAIRNAAKLGKRDLLQLCSRVRKRAEGWAGAAMALLLLALATTPAHPGHERDELSLLIAAQTRSERVPASSLRDAGEPTEARIHATAAVYDPLDSGAGAIVAAHRGSP